MATIDGVAVKEGDIVYHKGAGRWLRVATERPANGAPWTNLIKVAGDCSDDYSRTGPYLPGPSTIRDLVGRLKETCQLLDTYCKIVILPHND